MKHLLKSQIFAIRNEEWLHSICPIPGQVTTNIIMETIADEEEAKDYQQLSWYKKLITIRTDNRWWKFFLSATRTQRFQEYRDVMKQYKQEEWDTTRDNWELVKVHKAGSFSDHLITIKNKETQKVYQCFCNNYGGDNPLIKLKRIC